MLIQKIINMKMQYWCRTEEVKKTLASVAIGLIHLIQT